MPKVSVIVPNYNHAPFLKERLDSVFNQTYKDFEVIILDDCSTDNSKEIIEEYRNRPEVSHIIYNDANSGSPFKQWAKGFELASGKYIWIAESDDWAEPNFLITLVPELEKNSNISIAFCNSIWFWPTTTKQSNVFPSDCLINGNKFFNHYMATKNSICNASSAVFRKENLKKISQTYKDFFGCGDWLFWIEHCWLGDIFYSNKILNHFRQFGNRASIENEKNANAYKEHLRIFRYLREKKRLSFFRRHCIAVFYITFEEKYPTIFQSNPETFKHVRSEWEKEVWNPLVSRVYVDFMYILWSIKSFIFSIIGKDPGTFL